MRREVKNIFSGATRTSRKGFTLLEVLIAMTLLAVGLLGTLGLTTGVIRGNFFSKNVSTATVIAETQLEEVHRRGYTGANTTNFPTGSELVTMGGATFSRDTTITDNSPQANMKKVKVKVTWSEGAAGNKEVLLETILAQ
jgi:type IV pilus assembly protein PilV